jgi:5-methylcytosine-specific restriction enzyme subunit McrC
MTIPIRNLYYMFLYAWARFPGGAIGSVGIDKSPDLPNLLARLLADGTKRLLRRGLDRGYRTFTEELIGPRGRLRLDRIIKEAAQLRGTAICDFDELTHDIVHNQILKATFASLAGCADIERELRHDLRLLQGRLDDVSDRRLTKSSFRQVAISRNNREYIFLMRLCEFVFWSLMPDEVGSGARFQKILEDEARMSAIFEEFLRSFYQLHRPEYRVRSESPEWHVADATEADRALLPRMITDITLRHPDHAVIIDAKFYQKTLAASPYGERVRAGHLYQLITYLQHERLRHPGRPVSGMLLYPEVDRPLRLRYRLLGVLLSICTVSLEQDWVDVEAELHNVLDLCRPAPQTAFSVSSVNAEESG